MSEGNGWNEWQRHVLAELKRLSRNFEGLSKEFSDLEVETARDLAALKVKAGLWGALGAAIPSAIAIIYMIMSN